jgi:hypothetical protein
VSGYLRMGGCKNGYWHGLSVPRTSARAVLLFSAEIPIEAFGRKACRSRHSFLCMTYAVSCCHKSKRLHDRSPYPKKIFP